MASTPLDFQALFEHAPHAYMVVDRSLRYVAANAAYRRLTDTTLEQLVGRAVIEVFPHDPADPNNASAARLRESLERVLRTGKPDELAVIPYNVPRARGAPAETRTWSATHTPLLDPQGEVAFVLQFTSDVTELHEPTRAQEPSSARLNLAVLDRAERVQSSLTILDTELQGLREMFDQAPGFLCFLRGPTHVFELANAAYMQLVGHRDVLHKAVREALPELEGQGFYELLDGVFATGVAFVGRAMPVMLQRTPGAPLEHAVVDLIYQAIRDKEGVVRGIFVQGSDVTAQARLRADLEAQHDSVRDAREALEFAQERQRFLAESIPVQVWTAAPDGALTFVNQRVVDYFQAPHDVILGAGWQAVLHPDDLDACLARWARSLETGEPYEVEFRLRRGDGEYRWHLGRAVAQRDHKSAVVSWFGSNTDIDEARRAIGELRLRSEYEQRLLGIVSHDLRGPLQTVSFASTLLLEGGHLPEKERKVVTRVVSAASRASRLIDDLLGFALARRGTSIPINPRPTNLREIVEQVVDEVHVLERTRTVRVGHHGDELGSWDADRIAQVVANLVGNAFQHSPPGTPVRVDSQLDAEHATLHVCNDGPPIASDELPHLFEPFKRGSEARSARGRSVGLGLFIARELVLAHGGTIEVSSSRDEGTCFTVRMPRYVAASA